MIKILSLYNMKKLFLLIALLQLGLLYAQNSIVLTFNQDNLVPSTNTFECEGSFTYFTINTNPVDTSYYVTLFKDGIILEQGNYSSINSQSPGFLALDSLIYAGFYELTVVSLSNNITFSDTFLSKTQHPYILITLLTTHNLVSRLEISI